VSGGDEDAFDVRRRRALYRAQHRGTKEMDLLMGRFAGARLPQMSETELTRFEALLALPDPDLQRWILAPGEGANAADAGPVPQFADLIDDVRDFHGLRRAARPTKGK
jgi:antitoxin CptB